MQNELFMLFIPFYALPIAAFLVLAIFYRKLKIKYDRLERNCQITPVKFATMETRDEGEVVVTLTFKRMSVENLEAKLQICKFESIVQLIHEAILLWLKMFDYRHNGSKVAIISADQKESFYFECPGLCHAGQAAEKFLKAQTPKKKVFA